MSRYANNMNTSPNKQSQRTFDDRKRGSVQYYAEYEQPDNGAQRSPTRDTAGPVQPQQRMAPVEQQRRPPVTNNDIPNQGPSSGSRPPSYAGGPFEERLSTKPDPAIQQRQQQKPRSYRRTDDFIEDTNQAIPPQASSGRPRPTQPARNGSNSLSNQSIPVTRATQPPKNGPEQLERTSPPKLEKGNSIPRLSSPSVMTSVLKPLNAKVQEYDGQMNQEQELIAQLDAEMAILQDRRREAEKRFMAAKTKHDDYKRQYQGVERALRGEPDMQQFSRLSVEDDDDRPSTQHTARAPPSREATSRSQRSESWGSLDKPQGGNRFRLSKLFGS